jgi:TRAP-type transport system periplasmic protein
MTRRNLAAAAFAVAAALAGSAAAEPMTLKLPIGSPLTSPVFLRATKPWVDEINKKGEGIFHVQIFPPGSLNNPRNVYDRLVTNVYELAYGIHGPIAGKFPKTSVAELPFLAKESTHASVAFWNLIPEKVIADEYAQVRPLALFIYPQNQLHFNRAVHNLDDLKGLKISAQSRVQADIVNSLGGTPITLAPPEVYQAGLRGVINGIVMAWTGVLQFKVEEVTSYHLETFMGSLTGFVLMNQGAYDRLPQKGKDIFVSTTGAKLSQRYGIALDGIARYQRDTVSKMKGQTILELTPAQRAAWEKRIQPVFDHWSKRVPDGPRVLAAFKAELKKQGAMN